MEFKEFESRVKAVGLVARDCGNGHWRIENGRYEVNWWPFSKKRTIYVNGLSSGNTTRYGDCEAAILAATTDPEIKRKGKRGARKKSYRRDKKRLLARDPRCYWCKCELNTQTATLDHVIPLARGGSNATDNLVLSCEPCNKDKGNALWEENDERRANKSADADHTNRRAVGDSGAAMGISGTETSSAGPEIREPAQTAERGGTAICEGQRQTDSGHNPIGQTHETEDRSPIG